MDSYRIPIEEALIEVKNRMKKDLAVDRYNLFIRDLTVSSVRGNKIVLKAAAHSNLPILRQNYHDTITEHFSEVTQIRYEIDYVVDDPDVEESEQTQDLNPKYSFEEFIVGRGNELARNAAKAVAEYSPGSPGVFNPLFLFGGVGLGKTHLMQAIGNYIRAGRPDSNVYYISGERLLNEFIYSISKGNTSDFRKKYRNLDVLLIDDIQFIVKSEKLQEELFNTFNTLYQQNKHIVLASDRPPKDLIGLEERLVSRFASGLVADIKPPDYETRKAILLKKLENYCSKFTVKEEVIEMIAQQVKTNIRDLEGTLNTLMLTSILTGVEPSTEAADQAIRKIISNSAKKKISVGDIKSVVADHFHIRVEDIDSKKRTKDIALARQVAMYLARSVTDYSLPKLGDEFGRDHTTVHHSITKIQADIRNDSDFAETIEQLIKALSG